jgi:hypothetical protein
VRANFISNPKSFLTGKLLTAKGHFHSIAVVFLFEEERDLLTSWTESLALIMGVSVPLQHPIPWPYCLECHLAIQRPLSRGLADWAETSILTLSLKPSWTLRFLQCSLFKVKSHFLFVFVFRKLNSSCILIACCSRMGPAEHPLKGAGRLCSPSQIVMLSRAGSSDEANGHHPGLLTKPPPVAASRQRHPPTSSNLALHQALNGVTATAPNPDNPQPGPPQQRLPVRLRALPGPVQDHHHDVQRRHLPVRVPRRDQVLVDEQARVARRHGGRDVAQDRQAVFVGPVVEDGVEVVGSGPCGEVGRVSW